MNSCYVEELRMCELASIVSTYRNKESNAYPVITQQVPLSPAHRELSAENVVTNNHDFQPGGPESQINEGENYQFDGAEGQNIPEGGNETHYFDGENDQGIPEGGNGNNQGELESQHANGHAEQFSTAGVITSVSQEKMKCQMVKWTLMK